MHVPSKITPSLTCLYNQAYGTSHDDTSVDLWIKMYSYSVDSDDKGRRGIKKLQMQEMGLLQVVGILLKAI